MDCEHLEAFRTEEGNKVHKIVVLIQEFNDLIPHLALLAISVFGFVALVKVLWKTSRR